MSKENISYRAVNFSYRAVNISYRTVNFSYRAVNVNYRVVNISYRAFNFSCFSFPITSHHNTRLILTLSRHIITRLYIKQNISINTSIKISALFFNLKTIEILCHPTLLDFRKSLLCFARLSSDKSSVKKMINMEQCLNTTERGTPQYSETNPFQ